MMNDSTHSSEPTWDIDIGPNRFFPTIRLMEIVRYKSLLAFMVYRNFIVYYQQTILGPIWWVLQPALMCCAFVLIFGVILNVSTDGIPRPLFFFPGLILWHYFSHTFSFTATLFSSQGSLFGKVYFPRLILPIANLISSLIKLALQGVCLIVLYLIYASRGVDVSPNWCLLLFPILIVYLAVLSLGFGLLFNSLTYKYRDLSLTLPFIIQMWMFFSSIMFPLSRIPEKYHIYLALNPVLPAVEFLRYALYSRGAFDLLQFQVGSAVCIIVLLLGLISFSQTEQTFIDSI